MDQLFSLKFTAKQLARQSKKSEKDEAKEKLKVKKAIEQGNQEGARIYAQNAIRAKNMSLNYLRLSSRVEAVAARVETAMKMKAVTQSMARIVGAMEASMQAMNLEKITQVMDQFEKQFEDLDVQSEYVEGAMSKSTALSTPQEEVDDLIAMTAEEHHIDLKEKFSELPAGARKVKEPKVEEPEQNVPEQKDELLERLSRLKAP
jgi:charged multivesicular body protein 1